MMPLTLLLPLGLWVLPMATETDIIGIVLNYGVLGIVTVAWVTGRIYSKSHVDDLKTECEKRVAFQQARIDSLEQIVAAFQRTTREQTLPALSRFADVLETPLEQQRISDLSVGNLDALLTRLEDRLNEGGGKR